MTNEKKIQKLSIGVDLDDPDIMTIIVLTGVKLALATEVFHKRMQPEDISRLLMKSEEISFGLLQGKTYSTETEDFLSPEEAEISAVEFTQ